MRVALVTGWFYPRRGGIESQLLGLVQALLRQGHQACVFTSFPGDAQVAGVPVKRTGCRYFPGSKLAVPGRLARALAEEFRAGSFGRGIMI